MHARLAAYGLSVDSVKSPPAKSIVKGEVVSRVDAGSTSEALQKGDCMIFKRVVC